MTGVASSKDEELDERSSLFGGWRREGGAKQCQGHRSRTLQCPVRCGPKRQGSMQAVAAARLSREGNRPSQPHRQLGQTLDGVKRASRHQR